MTSVTNWVPIDASIRSRKEMAELGVYRIRAVDQLGNAIPIDRIAGIDSEGILYIGRSGFFPGRRTVAIRLAEFQKGKHSGSTTYNRVKATWESCTLYKGHRLEAQALLLDLGKKVSACERCLQRIYIWVFGELPPLNSQKPW